MIPAGKNVCGNCNLRTNSTQCYNGRDDIFDLRIACMMLTDDTFIDNGFQFYVWHPTPEQDARLDEYIKQLPDEVAQFRANAKKAEAIADVELLNFDLFPCREKVCNLLLLRLLYVSHQRAREVVLSKNRISKRRR